MVEKEEWLTLIERERENYMAQSGATEDGFREHIWELVKANPKLSGYVARVVFDHMMREIRPEH